MTSLSRWRAGTLAAAGTIPVRPMGADAIPGKSQGHHPAGDRPADPTRAYESGSDGHRRHAAPARHPYPPRPPPGRATRNPHALAADCPGGRHSGLKGACGVAARALRAPVTPGAARVIWQRSRPWASPARSRTTCANHAESSDKRINQAQEQQELDGPLQMRSLWQMVESRAVRRGGTPRDRAALSGTYCNWIADATEQFFGAPPRPARRPGGGYACAPARQVAPAWLW